MTATVTQRNTPFVGIVPSKGTLPVAANELILKGTIVCSNASALAVAGVDGEGFAAIGKASATADNRTTAPEGGGAGAINVEIEFGVFGWLFSGDTPEPGQVVFVVDNQTVSVDSDSGARGIAGYVSEVVGSTCYVLMGPTVVGQIVIAAAEAADLDQAQIDIDALEVRADALEAASTWESPNLVPLLRVSTGADVPAFTDGVADGYQLTDSEALSLRINDDSTTIFTTTISIPEDNDDAEDIVIKILGARIGAADVADVALTIGAFFHTVGAAHTADGNAGGESSSFVAATTVISEETLTILAADVPASPCDLTLTFVVTSELDADDLIITSIKATGLRAL
jgi:hypothetical protein